MNNRIKTALFVVLGLVAAVLLTGCGDTTTPYETNNAESYTVSVKYDANGGIFTTNTSVIVDSYNVSDMETNGKGMAEIALLSPDNTARGNDAFTAIKNGYFLAGWYESREEVTDASGNKSYTYSGKWDFENGLLEVDPGKEYSSETPVLTLYAAWVPLFEIEFYSLDNNELLETYTYDPTANGDIKIPAWDESTGTIEMFKFPERSGYTFEKAYLDANGTQAIETESFAHTGAVNYETGTAENPKMKLFVEWKKGEWYRIYNADQFIKNASLNGNYEILADLDFNGKVWPTSLMYGNFNGKIEGNGHTFKNITFAQTNNSKTNAGLFGNITENASITDVTFENVTFSIKAGTRVVGTNYGLLAGTISKDAVFNNVSIVNGTVEILADCYFGVDDYSIGLVCGMGNDKAVANADIKCVAADRFIVTVDGNAVTLEEATEQ